MKTMGKSDHEHPLLRAPFLVLHQRERPVSVVFVFNASLKGFTPVFLMLNPVDLMILEKSGLLVDAIRVLFLLYSQHTSSSVSAVFDFNASLNDFAPLSPILLSVDMIRMEKS